MFLTLLLDNNKQRSHQFNNWFIRQHVLRSSRYEAHGKFGGHKRCIRVARGIADSSFLSALQTSQVLHILMNAQLTHEPIVL